MAFTGMRVHWQRLSGTSLCPLSVPDRVVVVVRRGESEQLIAAHGIVWELGGDEGMEEWPWYRLLPMG